eukprot:CAMPEP_0174822254 /NCGR_PEP_ID=MMETSP1107-20130205/14625_1 /TAXON_ID=36770 /ORGANISM="Paraphysomonas vestita, Strain GFlagA" /LENGTH=88 /DNA_ID=CAMNT_0016040703 /DNA_START=63 /DNA_END=329 /DNA_ORIENTATION=+
MHQVSFHDDEIHLNIVVVKELDLNFVLEERSLINCFFFDFVFLVVNQMTIVILFFLQYDYHDYHEILIFVLDMVEVLMRFDFFEDQIY